MSEKIVLGESFLPWVEKQVEVRQKVLTPKIINPRDPDPFNQYSRDVLMYMNLKTPWIKLTSGVNVSEAKAQELGVPGLAGSLLAQTSILEAGKKYYGGVVQEIGEVFDKNTGASTQVTQSYDHIFTGGISRSPDDYDSSYGYSPGVGLPSRFNTFKGLPADFTSYGKVPPPGITSIEIKPIGEQGTVREATINIICHNLAQFKIIDALYLRLKYSILLEWGHSIYFDNNQKLITDPSYDLANGYFLSNGNSSDVILDKIEQTRIKSGGNYDGFLGYVTNFNWTHRGDGGYNITVFARGMGDVIESLKVNVNYPGGAISTELPPLTEEEMNSLPTDVTPDQYPPTIFYKNKSTLNQILFAIKRYIDKNGPSVSGYATNDISLGTTNISQLTLDLSNYEVYPNYVDKDEYTSGAPVTSANNILFDQEVYRAKFVIF
jgi:hypothetical protein